MLRAAIAGFGCLLVFGCEDPPKEAPKTEEPIQISPTKVEAEPAKESPEQAAEKAAEAEKAKEQAAVEANPLTECCRSLGKLGFMQRSPDFIAASKVCGEAMTANQSKAEAMPAIKKSLGKEGLPSECD